MGSHTLYFIYAHRFSRINEWLHKQALKRYDALICEGQMAEELVKKILGPDSPPLYTVINGIPEEHFPKENEIIADHNSKNILFMGHGPGKERLWYKGLDIMIEAFKIAKSKDPELTFTVVGDWNKELIDSLLQGLDPETTKSIRFAGKANNLEPFIKNCGLYLHCARGEAYGLTILIAMSYGLPALVSEWTGAKEIVSLVDGNLIAKLDKSDIAGKINWFFGLSEQQKKQLSDKSRETALRYTEKTAVEFHQKTFQRMMNDFDK